MNDQKRAMQLRHDILDTIKEYSRDYDITIYQALGVLELVKNDLIKILENAYE